MSKAKYVLGAALAIGSVAVVPVALLAPSVAVAQQIVQQPQVAHWFVANLSIRSV